MAKNVTANLDMLTAALADDTVNLNAVAQNGTLVPENVVKNATVKNAVKKNGTVKPAAPSAPTVVRVDLNAPTRTAVKDGTASTEQIVIDGFAMTMQAGSPEATILRAIVDKGTKNPWFEICEWLSVQAPRYIRIERAAGATAKSAPSPMARIKAAIARGNDLRSRYALRGTVPANLKGFGKLTADAHATEKGVWFLVRMP